MFIAASLTTAKAWRQSKGLSTDKWINKQIVIHPYNGYYSIIKRNKPLTHTINFKSIMLNERSLGQEATFCIIPVKGHSGKGKTTQMKIRPVVVKVLDVGREVTAKVPERMFNSDRTVRYLDCGSSTTAYVKVIKLCI